MLVKFKIIRKFGIHLLKFGKSTKIGLLRDMSNKDLTRQHLIQTLDDTLKLPTMHQFR